MDKFSFDTDYIQQTIIEKSQDSTRELELEVDKLRKQVSQKNNEINQMKIEYNKL